LPYQQSTPLDPSSSKQDQEVQDLCREILMVRITEEPEGDPTERLSLDDYNSEDFNEYLSDNMKTTPTITEAQVATKEKLLQLRPLQCDQCWARCAQHHHLKKKGM